VKRGSSMAMAVGVAITAMMAAKAAAVALRTTPLPFVEGRRTSDELERVMGIEPTLAAWEAAVLPLNYTRNSA
jgi:hypothetical protein